MFITSLSYSQIPTLKQVFSKERLVVLDSNVTISGYVQKVDAELDGDYHIQLKLDSTFNYLLDKGNINKQDGCLVLEIVCGRKTIWPFNCPCKGFKNTILIPKQGDYIRVSGYFVYDKTHGWNEIHPIVKMEFISKK